MKSRCWLSSAFENIPQIFVLPCNFNWFPPFEGWFHIYSHSLLKIRCLWFDCKIPGTSVFACLHVLCSALDIFKTCENILCHFLFICKFVSYRSERTHHRLRICIFFLHNPVLFKFGGLKSGPQHSWHVHWLSSMLHSWCINLSGWSLIAWHCTLDSDLVYPSFRVGCMKFWRLWWYCAPAFISCSVHHSYSKKFHLFSYPCIV